MTKNEKQDGAGLAAVDTAGSIDSNQLSHAAPPLVQQLADMVGGRIDSHGLLPDGSGFATMSMPLPKHHWLTADPDRFDVPPMPLRLGVDDRVILIIGGETKTLTRKDLNEMVRAAGRYAMRASSDRGRIADIDPDALVQNLVVGLLGYHTTTGLSGDDWANPPQIGTGNQDSDGTSGSVPSEAQESTSHSSEGQRPEERR